jgi:rubrerythrin
MVTLVGTQGDLAAAIKELIELDYDAVEAYEAAINRLDNQDYKEKLSEFKKDHQRHIQELSILLGQHQITEIPSGPSTIKQWLAKGKVVLAELVGDSAILAAMKSNEIDTNTAYERFSAREDLWADARPIILRGLEDEKRHKAWLETR